MQRKLLRVETPRFVAGANVYWDEHLGGTWGEMAPILKGVIGNQTPNQFMQFMKGIGALNGWRYQWL